MMTWGTEHSRSCCPDCELQQKIKKVIRQLFLTSKMLNRPSNPNLGPRIKGPKDKEVHCTITCSEKQLGTN